MRKIRGSDVRIVRKGESERGGTRKKKDSLKRELDEREAIADENGEVCSKKTM